MKKKILIIIVAVVVIVGGVVAALALTGGGVSEEDNAQGEDTNVVADSVLKDAENIEKPEAAIKDSVANSLEDQLGLDEEFDPAAEL